MIVIIILFCIKIIKKLKNCTTYYILYIIYSSLSEQCLQKYPQRTQSCISYIIMNIFFIIAYLYVKDLTKDVSTYLSTLLLEGNPKVRCPYVQN